MAKLGKIVKLVKDAWLVLGVTLLLSLLIESSFSLVFLIKDYYAIGSLSPPIDFRVIADTYSDTTWVHDYYEEFRSSFDARWTPYVYWRRKPFQGKYININSDGIRVTHEAATSQKEADTPVTIFMFGGSTLWGTGVRDGFTIPAIVAKELWNKGIAGKILNFGESGHVSTQEVITLLLQLQKGNIPDAVIFYDGVNDIYSAYQQRVAGIPQNEFHRVMEFNLSNPDKLRQRIRMVFQDAVSGLSTLRFLNAPLGLFSVGHQSEPIAHPLPFYKKASDTKSLVREVVTTYWSNVELVTALGEHYHFRCLFYWQPTIFQKEHLTKYERLERQKDQALENFYQYTNDVMKQSRPTQKSKHPFQDLSMVFADTREPLYIDWAHLGESGNEIIARRMAKDVLSTIGVGKGAARDGDSAALRRRG